MHLHAAHSHSPPLGKTSSSSSLRIVPETSVPVTTVPKPFMVKTRSMGRRAIAFESLRRNLTCDPDQLPLQIVHSSAGERTHSDDRVGASEKRSAQKLFHFEAHNF